MIADIHTHTCVCVCTDGSVAKADQRFKSTREGAHHLTPAGLCPHIPHSTHPPANSLGITPSITDLLAFQSQHDTQVRARSYATRNLEFLHPTNSPALPLARVGITAPGTERHSAHDTVCRPQHTVCRPQDTVCRPCLSQCRTRKGRCA